MRQPLPLAGMRVAHPAAGRWECRAAIGLWLVVALLVFAVRASTQERFRITYDVKWRDAKATLLEGRVFNDTGRDAFDVWVTAEALSASGKVLGRGIAFVGSAIYRGDSASFEAKLPAAEGVETFRIAVTSYRAGSEAQSP